jgi:hypothetical protein
VDQTPGTNPADAEAPPAPQDAQATPASGEAPPVAETNPAGPAGDGDGQVSSQSDGQPGFRSRGRARRRARFLSRARELAYRDLGGLVYNLHRFGQRNDALVLAKLSTLGHIDEELRAIERALDERRPVTVLREAGITACPRCAAIHASEDRFCPNCGLPMSRNADLPVSGAPVAEPAAGGTSSLQAGPAAHPGGVGAAPAHAAGAHGAGSTPATGAGQGAAPATGSRAQGSAAPYGAPAPGAPTPPPQQASPAAEPPARPAQPLTAEHRVAGPPGTGRSPAPPFRSASTGAAETAEPDASSDGGSSEARQEKPATEEPTEIIHPQAPRP